MKQMNRKSVFYGVGLISRNKKVYDVYSGLTDLAHLVS